MQSCLLLFLFHRTERGPAISSLKSKLLAWYCSHLFLSLLYEDRMRFGRFKSEKQVFLLPLRSPFTIFVDLIEKRSYDKIKNNLAHSG